MKSEKVLLFLAGFGAALVLSRFDATSSFITGGNKFFK